MIVTYNPVQTMANIVKIWYELKYLVILISVLCYSVCREWRSYRIDHVLHVIVFFMTAI